MSVSLFCLEKYILSNAILGKSVWLMSYKLNVASEPALEFWRGYESLANFQNSGTPYPTALFHFYL